MGDKANIQEESSFVPLLSSLSSRRFRPYPEYQNSGAEWIGEIPSHWSTKRVKNLVHFQGGGTPSKENLEYWSGNIPWVSPKDMKTRLILDTADKITVEAVEQSATNLVDPGAVLLVVRSGILNHSIPVAIAGTTVALNQDLKALVPGAEVLPKYLSYVIDGKQSPLLVEWRKEGATVESLELELIENSRFPLPPKSEQRAIVEFLDRETGKIDALVAKKERLIELLQEKGTALITQAVTKGLNPDASMKDSGVEWLGEIPAHWTCLALSRITKSKCDGPFGAGLKSEHYCDEGIRVIRLQNIGSGTFRGDDAAYIDRDYYEHELGDHDVLTGDVLIAGLGDDNHPVGRACVAPSDLGPAMVKADCFRFRLDSTRVSPMFAAYQLSSAAKYSAGWLATGATRSRVNLSATASKKVALPSLDEQQAIVEILDIEKAKIDPLIAKIREGIARLKEFRTALISAAVTGKIDVREEVA